MDFCYLLEIGSVFLIIQLYELAISLDISIEQSWFEPTLSHLFIDIPEGGLKFRPRIIALVYFPDLFDRHCANAHRFFLWWRFNSLYGEGFVRIVI